MLTRVVRGFQKLAQIWAHESLRTAGVMVIAVSWLALNAPLVKGDIGVVGVSPRHANPGEAVNVSIASGAEISSPRGRGPFPVSLVPLADAPKPHRCSTRAAALCLPAALGPPREAPFVYLGQATHVENQGKPYLQYFRLHFRVPTVAPGLYSFVIYSAGSYPGPRGGLMIDYKDRSKLLRVDRGSVGGDGGDGIAPLWLAVAAAIVGITFGGVVLRRRR
jgi:hypothetical protein